MVVGMISIISKSSNKDLLVEEDLIVSEMYNIFAACMYMCLLPVENYVNTIVKYIFLSKIYIMIHTKAINVLYTLLNACMRVSSET